MISDRVTMARETLKIAVSLLGAGAIAVCAFLLLETILTKHGAPGPALLFRFQLSAMLAMGLFAGLAIVFYARLSRALGARKTGAQKDCS